jgi:hypothetical protein
MSDIIYKYLAKKRPDGEFIIGAPLRDLTQADLDGMAPEVRKTVESVLYFEPVKTKTKPKSSEVKSNG